MLQILWSNRTKIYFSELIFYHSEKASKPAQNSASRQLTSCICKWHLGTLLCETLSATCLGSVSCENRTSPLLKHKFWKWGRIKSQLRKYGFYTVLQNIKPYSSHLPFRRNIFWITSIESQLLEMIRLSYWIWTDGITLTSEHWFSPYISGCSFFWNGQFLTIWSCYSWL